VQRSCDDGIELSGSVIGGKCLSDYKTGGLSSRAQLQEVSSYCDSVLHSEDGILPYRSTYLRVIQFTQSLLVNFHLSYNLSILLPTRSIIFKLFNNKTEIK
jgi:hypothetical protein